MREGWRVMGGGGKAVEQTVCGIELGDRFGDLFFTLLILLAY